MTIFEALQNDHDCQRALAERLAEPGRPDASRREALLRLARVLQRHGRAEEHCFYVPRMMYAPTLDMSRHSRAEHNALESLIARLQQTEAGCPTWLTTARQGD